MSRDRRADQLLGLRRAVALRALLAGAVGSVSLTLYASRNAPRLLIVIFALWVLSPFGVLALADAASARWPTFTRAALYGLMLALTVGSLAIYGADVLRPPKAQAAFVLVIVPPASWLIIVTVLAIAAFRSARRSPAK